MKEPRVIEHRHVLALRGLWAVAQALVTFALRPLVEGWDASTVRLDERDEQAVLQELLDWFDRVSQEEGAAALVNRLGVPPRPSPLIVDKIAITRQIDWLELTLGEWLITKPEAPVLTSTSRAISEHAGEAIESLLHINVRRDVPGLKPLIDQWREANIDLIESGLTAPRDVALRPSLLGDVSELVERAHSEGWRVERLQRNLVERFNVSNSRAELIARDQVLKLNSNINKQRQEDAGITSYRWSTSKDERVRDSHRHLEGKVFEWEAPPSEGNPGEPIQCRCQAIPILPDWL